LMNEDAVTDVYECIPVATPGPSLLGAHTHTHNSGVSHGIEVHMLRGAASLPLSCSAYS
jgi:hypothetical protein